MSRIDDIDKKIALLEAEKQKLLQIEKEQALLTNWKDIQDKITNLTDDQVLFEALNIKTKTIPLFDKFCYHQKSVLGLWFNDFEGYYQDNTIFSSQRKIYAPICLLLIKNWKAVRCKPRTLTISDLKKCSHNDLKKITYDNNALNELFREINGAPRIEFEESMRKNGYFKKKYYPLSNPIFIGAQTSQNREGYGNIYNGETLIHEGTKYGETTPFLIVGIRVGDCYSDDSFLKWLSHIENSI